MRIESGTVGMESAQRVRSLSVKTGRFVFKEWSPKSEEYDTTGDLSERESDEEQDSQKVKDTKGTAAWMGVRRAQIPRAREDFANSFHQYVVRYIFMLLFGEKRKDLWNAEDVNPAAESAEPQAADRKATLSLQPFQMKTFTYEEETYYEEEQSFSFASTGNVRTADGRDISFQVNLNMSQSFSAYYRRNMDAQTIMKTCDPLVINFDDSCAKLTDQTITFDLDADGEAEEIAGLGSGSGYLALDRNEDGEINDGSELFGPRSGDGFQDLAQYDLDHNGWIDENDEIFEKLKIWVQKPDGTKELYKLKDKGVGAICLSKVGTEYAIRNSERAEKGYLRSTGIFLFEDGRAGTMQHLDLVQ